MRGTLAALLAFAFFLPLSAFADTESSQHYTIEQGTLSGGDNTDASSASYSSQNSLGEPATGPSSGTSYGGETGFDRGSSSSDSSGDPGSSGGSGTAGSGSSGGVVLGCSDPAALNYSPQALSSNDSGCDYSTTALSQPSPAQSQEPSSSGAAQAAAAVEAASSSTGVAANVAAQDPSGIAFSLSWSSVAAGSSLSTQVSFSEPLAAPVLLSFSIVRADGSVATSSIESAQIGSRTLSDLISLAQLPPGEYTLHLRAIRSDGTSEDFNQPFTVTQAAPSRTQDSEWILFAVVLALCVLFLYYRRKRGRV